MKPGEAGSKGSFLPVILYAVHTRINALTGVHLKMKTKCLLDTGDRHFDNRQAGKCFVCKTSRCVQSVWKLMLLLTFTDSSSRWE